LKFKFTLEKVLHHRKTLEDLAQRDFQVAQAALNAEVEILEQMKTQVIEAREAAFKRQSQGGSAGPALSQVHEFLTGQDVRIERQQNKVQEFQNGVENLREILRQKAIDYKMIESLKDKKRKEFKKELNLKEQKASDEMSTIRFLREQARIKAE
jgi:flagellar protein FliJ